MGQITLSEAYKRRVFVSRESQEITPLQKMVSLTPSSIEREDFPVASVLFTADIKTFADDESLLEILINETSFGQRFLEECRTEMFMKFERALLNWENALNDPSKTAKANSLMIKPTLTKITTESEDEFRVIPPTEEDWEKLSDDDISTAPDENDDDETSLVNASPFGTVRHGKLGSVQNHIPRKSNTSHSLRILQAVLATPKFSMRRILANALNKQVPQSFLWTSSNTQWQTRLRSAKLSLFIRIVNNTSYYMVYDDIKTRQTFAECNLIEFPAETLLPFGVTEFGVASDKFGLKNYGGKIIYSICNRFGEDPSQAHNESRIPNYLVFSFEYFNSPPVSRHKISCAHILGTKPGGLVITKHVESYNEGTLIYRIFDPADQVYFQAVSAFAFKPNSLTRVLGSPPCCGGVEYAQQMAKYAATIKSRGVNITQSFCAAVFQYCQLNIKTDSNLATDSTFIRAENRSHADDTGETINNPASVFIDRDVWAWTGLWTTSNNELNMTQASQSISHLICTTSFDMPMVKTLLQEMGFSDPVQSVYLEYKIGAELFHAVFQPWESFEMRTIIPGGFRGCDKSVLLSSRAADYKSMISPLLEEQLWQWEKRFLRGEIGSPEFREVFLRLKRRNRHEKMINLGHRALLLLCEGFEPYLTHQCQVSRAEEWTTKYDVPECHVWEQFDGRGPFLDAQGLIFYVTMNWTDKLSDIFPEGIALFQPVRELTARWSIQDYESITAGLVHQCVESSAAILQRIGEIRTVMSLKLINETLAQLYGDEFKGNLMPWGSTSSSPTTDASSGKKVYASSTRQNVPEYIFAIQTDSRSPTMFNWESFAGGEGTPFDI